MLQNHIKLKREEKAVQGSWNEKVEQVFTINFACPHCKKPLSISIDKLELTPI